MATEKKITLPSLPFNGEWYVFQGGDTKEQNYHHGNQVQHFAFDLLKVDKGRQTHKGSGERNEDYYAFGANILAPISGQVVEVVNGLADNIPLEVNGRVPGGNYVLLKIAGGLFMMLAHFQYGSITVSKGEEVKAGQKLGECGNSGYSTQPHLHLHVQDSDISGRHEGEELEYRAVAKGVKCYFERITVERDGKKEIQKKYSPVRGDIIGPAS